MLVNPLKPVTDAFLAFFSVLPQPLLAIVYLSVALFVTSCIISFIFR